MRRLPLILPALFLAALPLPATAQEGGGCADFAPPVIEVSVQAQTPSLDTSQDLASIRSLSDGRPQQFSSTRHDTPVGITAAALDFRSNYKIASTTRRKEEVTCSQISQFSLSIAFDPVVIYVANEIPPSSCAFKSVLVHEYKHVSVDRSLVDRYRQPIQEVLREAVAKVGVIRGKSEEETEAQISARISAILQDLAGSMNTLREQAQRQVDTPEEYDRLGQSCDGQIAKLITH